MAGGTTCWIRADGLVHSMAQNMKYDVRGPRCKMSQLCDRRRISQRSEWSFDQLSLPKPSKAMAR